MPSVDILIAEFAGRDGDSAFANLARGEVADGLRQRLGNPVTLDQGAATFSGPAALLFCLMQDAPELYVQYVVDLFENGRTMLGALEIAPGEACRAASPPPDRIAAVDWIALASLRDVEMPVTSYELADDTGLPLTEPTVLAAWFAAAGYRHLRNEASAFFTKGAREATQLGSLYLQGRRVCLFISADMLNGSGDRSQTLRPNQWTVITAPVMLAADGITLTLYQWGTTQRVPPFGALRLEPFCHNFYGFVAAMPPATREAGRG
jgi:hypothetical protein